MLASKSPALRPLNTNEGSCVLGMEKSGVTPRLSHGLAMHSPTHSFTHLPIHPPSTKPILLLSSVWFSRPAAARAGRVGLPARGKGPVLPRGLRGREAGDTPGVWRRLSRARPSRHLRASLSHVTVASSLLPVARARARRLDSRARSTGPSPREEKRRRERARRPGGAGVSGGCRGRLFTKARVAVA